MVGGIITMMIMYHAVLYKSLPNKKDKKENHKQININTQVLPLLTSDQEQIYNDFTKLLNNEIHEKVFKIEASNETIERCKTIKHKQRMNKELLSEVRKLDRQERTLMEWRNSWMKWNN